ncbi:aminotransferase class I/II-fold pyridoxal phosphate-dependent enzyme [Acidocella sp.]|uniref:aminotransferase class I/II-fold pyridoxal phosphate-dependent enzyme n=1 Tax=Acidocella sp. TaxID=50710 RepID=UPI003D011853
MQEYDSYWRQALENADVTRRLRRLRSVQRLGAGKIRFGEGKILTDFSSNDYLGLSHHPALLQAAGDYAERFGAGAGGSRLVSGNLAPLEQIEHKLSQGKRTEAALVFVSGAQANLTLLPALLDARVLGKEPLVYADRLNHASLIQGCIAAGVRQNRFRHNDMEHLRDLLVRDAAKKAPRFIVTESVFSMDGDVPDLVALRELADQFGAFLYIDEAHATGVLGTDGFGLGCGLNNALVMGTFSKGLGGFGAYVAGSEMLRNYLINRCGGIIYATGLPPAVLGTMNAALDLIPSMETEREHLVAMATHLRKRLQQAGLNTGASTTHIVPLILGDEEHALSLASALVDDGFYAVAIRPPTVPPGTSRLRLAVSACHTREDIDRLADAITRRIQ